MVGALRYLAGDFLLENSFFQVLFSINYTLSYLERLYDKSPLPLASKQMHRLEDLVVQYKCGRLEHIVKNNSMPRRHAPLHDGETERELQVSVCNDLWTRETVEGPFLCKIVGVTVTQWIKWICGFDSRIVAYFFAKNLASSFCSCVLQNVIRCAGYL